MGAEKNRLNEMVLTFFVLIYLFIYLSIYSHSCICSHFFYSCASCSYALKNFCNVEKLAIYICCYAGDDVTSFDITLVTLWHTSVSDNVKMYKYQYAKFDQNICVVQEL